MMDTTKKLDRTIPFVATVRHRPKTTRNSLFRSEIRPIRRSRRTKIDSLPVEEELQDGNQVSQAQGNLGLAHLCEASIIFSCGSNALDEVFGLTGRLEKV